MLHSRTMYERIYIYSVRQRENMMPNYQKISRIYFFSSYHKDVSMVTILNFLVYFLFLGEV